MNQYPHRGARKKSIAAGNQNFVIVDKNGNIVDKRALIRNLGNYSNRHNGKGLGLHTLRQPSSSIWDYPLKYST